MHPDHLRKLDMLQAHDSDEHHGSALMIKDQEAFDDFLWRQETVTLNTVGIDIGSSTSHLIFSRVVLQRRTEQLSSRFVVIHRDVLWESPISLTPFTDDGLIDARLLSAFIQNSYHNAGVSPKDIDSGAVILTGEAIKRKNARAIDEIFAKEAGKFVCATAGHKLECILSAHGSGAVEFSRSRKSTVLHVDIGGGTTKLALIDRGVIVSVSAFAVGGRLIAQDDDDLWTRIDEPARQVANDLGLDLTPAMLADAAVRDQIVNRMLDILMANINGQPLGRLGMTLQLTETLDWTVQPRLLTVSGGVSEYVLDREEVSFGDIAQRLGHAFRERLGKEGRFELVDPGQGIRATVIGASQFTLQVSGKTVYLTDGVDLPVQNIPVVNPQLDLTPENLDEHQLTRQIRTGLKKLDLNPASSVAIMLAWNGDPSYRRLHALAMAIKNAMATGNTQGEPLILVIDRDVGRSLGRVLHRDIGIDRGFLALDGLELKELDFIDLGQRITPPGVIPVVIKSLLFA